MERKLATAMFVDLVDSTALVARTDPEVARRRVTGFFDTVNGQIQSYGGTVEKFAGDAVVAVFGVPTAHEDDAERAIRAALAVLETTRAMGLEVRVGIEAGEVVAETGDSTFATGEAMNLAARLQQAAEPGEILIGPTAQGLAEGLVVTEPVGTRALKGFREEIAVRRVVCADGDGGRPVRVVAPYVGREEELELLENAYARAVRDRRANLVTVFGEPGIGKSRLAREFVAGLERTTILSGRCLPFGDGVTYWPLAEMVKAASGISDDDPAEEALEKLRESCADDAIADLLGLAAGVLDTVGGGRTGQEIVWAAHEWAAQLAEVQPLVLVFEDLHWAEEPLLDLVEHLADRVRDAPVVLLCLARPELLDTRPAWGGGRVRSVTVELGPLPAADSEELVDALLRGVTLAPELRPVLLDKTEGNPLFLEETVRMLSEQGERAASRIPDTVQALIAARIDRLSADGKTVLQHGAVVGRVFWRSAVASLLPEVDVDAALEALVNRELVTAEARSTLSGEQAYRFRHVLIQDVAYAGLTKSARSTLHRAFAAWLRERSVDELVETQAYHLDQAAALHAELDGAVADDLAAEAAAALERAGRRALARESHRSARRLLLRAVELEPTLSRRFLAARAAWKLRDLPSASDEMEQVRVLARDEGDATTEGLALIVLADVALDRDADVGRARELGNEALAVLGDAHGEARYEALLLLSEADWWEGDLGSVERHSEEMIEIARASGRKDLESRAMTYLVGVHRARLEHDLIQPVLDRAIVLAEESGSLTARAAAAHQIAASAFQLGDEAAGLEAAELGLHLYDEVGSVASAARIRRLLATEAMSRGDTVRAEKQLREAVRMLAPVEERGTVVEVQRLLAQVLLAQGKVAEAERWALTALRTVGDRDVSRASARLALGQVRAAQGRADEAEELLREALAIIEETDYRAHEAEHLEALSAFLAERGRDGEAGPLEERLVGLRAQASSAARIA
ncbi:MAG TPA: AAA family ATPase [Gaiella sp.]